MSHPFSQIKNVVHYNESPSLKRSKARAKELRIFIAALARMSPPQLNQRLKQIKETKPETNAVANSDTYETIVHLLNSYSQI